MLTEAQQVEIARKLEQELIAITNRALAEWKHQPWPSEDDKGDMLMCALASFVSSSIVCLADKGSAVPLAVALSKKIMENVILSAVIRPPEESAALH